MTNDPRSQALLRLMRERPNGLELVMQRYQQLTGRFPDVQLTPRQIIEAIVQLESPHDRPPDTPVEPPADA